MSVQGFAAKGPREKLVPFVYDLEPLGPHDVVVAITHCGICHSDIHLINNDWGITHFPIVAGHEIGAEAQETGGVTTE